MLSPMSRFVFASIHVNKDRDPRLVVSQLALETRNNSKKREG